MLSSPGTVSKILWHFPGGPIWNGMDYRPSRKLKPTEDAYTATIGILESKELRLGKAAERLDVTLPTVERIGIGPDKQHIYKEGTRAYLFSPVCCLADIPIMHLSYHEKRYGKIAIGFHRQSVIKAGFSPVFYQLQNSIALTALFQTILCLDFLGGMDPTYDFQEDVGPKESLPDEPYDAFNKRMKRDALTHARKHAAIAASFIKTFDDTEFDSIYTEREWRSISPFKFEYADVSMVVLPRVDGYFERFVAESESIGLRKTVSIVAWEDLVEH
jgi:hypothetical protein